MFLSPNIGLPLPPTLPQEWGKGLFPIDGKKTIKFFKNNFLPDFNS